MRLTIFSDRPARAARSKSCVPSFHSSILISPRLHNVAFPLPVSASSQGAIDSIGDTGSDIASKAGSAADDASKSVKSAAGNAEDVFKDATDSAKDAAKDV